MYINIIGHCTAFLPYLQVMRLLNCLAVILSLTNRHVVCCESVALQLFHIKIFFFLNALSTTCTTNLK